MEEMIRRRKRAMEDLELVREIVRIRGKEAMCLKKGQNQQTAKEKRGIVCQR